jgi:hypothetical protein
MISKIRLHGRGIRRPVARGQEYNEREGPLLPDASPIPDEMRKEESMPQGMIPLVGGSLIPDHSGNSKRCQWFD